MEIVRELLEEYKKGSITRGEVVERLYHHSVVSESGLEAIFSELEKSGEKVAVSVANTLRRIEPGD